MGIGTVCRFLFVLRAMHDTKIPKAAEVTVVVLRRDPMVFHYI